MVAAAGKERESALDTMVPLAHRALLRLQLLVRGFYHDTGHGGARVEAARRCSGTGGTLTRRRAGERARRATRRTRTGQQTQQGRWDRGID